MAEEEHRSLPDQKDDRQNRNPEPHGHDRASGGATTAIRAHGPAFRTERDHSCTGGCRLHDLLPKSRSVRVRP